MANNDSGTLRRHRVVIGLGVLGGILAASVLALGAASLGWDFGLSVQALERTIISWGGWGVAASIALMVAHSFIPFPAEFLAIANGMIFGPLWGTLITWTGAMLGAMIAFALARLLGRPLIAVVVARRDWHTVDNWAASRGTYVVLVARLIPVIAFNVINYAAGLSRIPWWTFIWTTGIGILPLTILMVLMGHNVDSLAWEAWVLLLAGALFLWFFLRRGMRPPKR